MDAILQELEENGDSEKFVTSAYKAQLMANKKWEDERVCRSASAVDHELILLTIRTQKTNSLPGMMSPRRQTCLVRSEVRL
eukprot:435921-Hanusia_phi.AAC.1